MQKPPRRQDDELISFWILVRYLLVGLYVGLATVAVFIYWYCFDNNPDNHTLVSISQLMTWSDCNCWTDFQPTGVFASSVDDACTYFTVGKIKAATLCQTVLVMIQLLNSFNAISEESSLLHLPPWTNPSLLVACAASFILHCMILYVPSLSNIFGVCALDSHDWLLVLAFSLPVLLIDEILKLAARTNTVNSE